MTKLKVTQKIQGNFGELLFEHFCQKNKYAYISPEEIYNTLTPRNILKFRFGDRRIPVRIPNNIVDEIREFSMPINKNETKPNFVFDFLTVSLNFSFVIENDKVAKMLRNSSRPPLPDLMFRIKLISTKSFSRRTEPRTKASSAPTLSWAFRWPPPKRRPRAVAGFCTSILVAATARFYRCR